MPHRQKHRGQHSNDPRLFHPDKISILNQAVDDFSFLLTRGYSDTSSLKLVGDRYRLTKRQRKAILRAGCSDQALEYRQSHLLMPHQLSEHSLGVDGYNLLITIESGLGGGMIFECRDGCYRDIASVHGTYRKVEETLPALDIIGKTFQNLNVNEVVWYLDKPVSNSGRLRHIMLDFARKHNFEWTVYLVNNPDRSIAQAENLITVSSDGWVIDHSMAWINVAKYILDKLEGPNIISLRGKQRNFF